MGCLFVDSQVKVPISIGDKYQDEVISDVLPRRTSHMLLGRTWLFDNQVIYNGYSNSYAF